MVELVLMEKSFDYSLSIKNLKEIPFHMYENDFKFHVNGKTYQTNRLFADILSPSVRQLHYSDKTVNEFYINIKNSENQKTSPQSKEEEDYFPEFLQLCTFENINIDSKQRKQYANYFYSLGNIEEFLRIQPEYSEDITEDNAIDRLSLLTNILKEHQLTPNLQDSNPIQKIIEFVSSHFESIDKEKIKQLNIDTFELIINNEYLKLQDEDALLRFLLELYSEERSYSQLFQYVLFNNVSEEMISNFISVFKIEDLNDATWKSICQRILGKKTENETKRYLNEKNVLKFERVEGKEFEGIMRHLTNETGGNIHDNGTIEITSNSYCYHPKNLVDYQNENYYHSTDRNGNAFICFNFKDKSVNLSSYTIKSNSNPTGSNNYNLKSWVIEVSKDGNNWIEIDRHENDSTLNGSKIIHTFKIQHENNDFFQFVKLRQTGDSWTSPSDKRIWFYFLEFYGKIKYPSN